ncbi:hypothetical protein PAXRUDRAFT_165593, partial [Paxillus rubicundulus Ve08.2h10]
DGIMIIITPLNILGEKNEIEGNLFGIPAVNLTAKTATDVVFKEIERFKYRIIGVSPEHILNDPQFGDLFKLSKFTDRLFNITVDEGHCVSEWGDGFQSDYGELGKLRWLLPSHITFHVASATMPPHILQDVQNKLHMRSNRLVKVIWSNDRPNIHIVVTRIENSLKSMQDLDHILNFESGQPPTPFMVFVNGRDEAERLAKYVRRKVLQHSQDKFVWFHSGMSTVFCLAMIEKLRKGELWGVFCTDAAGMGLDLHEIRLVIQWRYTKSLCTLLQRLGRAARDPNLEAVAVYFVEGEYFDDDKPGKASKKRKSALSSQKASKRTKLQSTEVQPITHTGSRTSTVTGCAWISPNSRVAAPTIIDAIPSMSLSSIPTTAGSTSASQASQAPPVRILPAGLEIEEYEAFAMKTFINAHGRGFCRHKVLDEYFDNPKGTSFSPDVDPSSSTHWGSRHWREVML